MTTAIDPRALDKLVDGELDEACRAELLRALDECPDGWKRCALAFLEAQSWGGALGVAAHDRGGASPAAGPQPRPTHLFVRQFMALAAAVVVAFCAGFVARPAASTRGLASAEADEHPRVEHAPTVPEAAPFPRVAQTPPPNTVPAVPERVRLQMERQGYQVSGDRRLVPLALGDGRAVAVPVDTIRYRYVGQRIQ